MYGANSFFGILYEADKSETLKPNKPPNSSNQLRSKILLLILLSGPPYSF